MDEQNIPIDINTTKLLDWLISRRHVSKDWQESILKVREKINNAIQDMPAHDEIIKLLTGTHINYFHCIKIVEILKETEKDSKNIFGRYGSQRMKDWQDIISLYEKDNIYLGEAAQILIRNVNYEVPALKKQLSKLNEMQEDSDKKIRDYNKAESKALREFKKSCEQLGIKGDDIKSELLELVKELPVAYNEISEKIKVVQPAIDLYFEFYKFILNKEEVDPDIIKTLQYLIKNGNTTTYEYIHGEKPLKIEEEKVEIVIEKKNDDVIDFGDDNPDEIDFGDLNIDDVKMSDDQTIDWGIEETENLKDEDLNINVEDVGIVIEESGLDGGIAKGEEALTILDNPKTRENIINDLMELDAFLKMRILELKKDDGNLISVYLMQNAPLLIQRETLENDLKLSEIVSEAINLLTNKKVSYLHNIKHSPKYVDILTSNLKQNLVGVERIKVNRDLLEKKIKEFSEQSSKLEPNIKILIDKTKELQKDLENDISKKYKGRKVNIVGAVNTL